MCNLVYYFLIQHSSYADRVIPKRADVFESNGPAGSPQPAYSGAAGAEGASRPGIVACVILLLLTVTAGVIVAIYFVLGNNF